jgi:hypothetical protein
MKKNWTLALLLAATACASAGTPAEPPAPAEAAPPEPVPARQRWAEIAAWTPAQVREILDRTETTRLAPDLAHLSAGERTAVGKLIEVGRIFQRVYETQRHRDAISVAATLAEADDPRARDLATLYRLFQGPIATTLDNRREPFVRVEDAPPGKNVYPWDLTQAELDAYLAAHPDRRAERSPEIFGAAGGSWRAAVAPQFAEHLTADANFQRTLWHEVGHYLGVDRTRDGRNLDEALGADANLLEEMKADLVSLFAGQELRRRGYYTDATLRSLYASGIYRTLQNVRPRREQPYQTMQLMQFNWFVDRGVLRVDPASRRLSIDYGRYPAAVEALLREVLAVQDAGDPARAQAFVTRWANWDEALHGRIAANIRAVQRVRYRLFTYAALGE